MDISHVHEAANYERNITKKAPADPNFRLTPQKNSVPKVCHSLSVTYLAQNRQPTRSLAFCGESPADLKRPQDLKQMSIEKIGCERTLRHMGFEFTLELVGF